MNSKSDVAIEYFTVFNFEVESDECQSIDEFAPTTTTPTSTTTTTSTTVPSTTARTTSTEELSSTSMKPSTTTMTTDYSPRDESTSTTTEQALPEVSSFTSTDGFSTTTTDPEVAPISNKWVWISLAAVFATLFFLSTASSAYIYVMNQHLLKLNSKLRESRHNKFQSEISHNFNAKKTCAVQDV